MRAALRRPNKSRERPTSLLLVGFCKITRETTKQTSSTGLKLGAQRVVSLQEGPPDEEAEAAADGQPQDDPVTLLPRLDPPHQLLQRPARTPRTENSSQGLGRVRSRQARMELTESAR